MKIGVVGASGYGNLGDDMYADALRLLLPGHELHLYNSDCPDELPKLDWLLYGGGGLVHHHESGQLRAHLEYMTWYADRHAGPIGFVCVGVQVRGPQFDLGILEAWRPLLERAAFVTARSPADAAALAALHGRPVPWFQDLGYWFARQAAPGPVRRDGPPLLIPRGPVGQQQAWVKNLLGPSFALLSLSKADDVRHLMRYRRRFPRGTIRRPQAAAHAAKIVAGAGLVVTGSYHGLVFARALGVPCRTIPWNWKLLHEPDDGPGPLGHAEVLHAHLRKG